METGDPVPVEEVEYIWMSDIQKLNRISMALRGTRPDSQDVMDVVEDPNQLESIVDEYLDSPEFGATIRDMYAEILQMRSPVVLPPLGELLDTYTQERKCLSFRGIIGANRTHCHGRQTFYRYCNDQ